MSVRLSFRLVHPAEIEMLIYDVQGRLVADIMGGHQAAGDHFRSVSGFDSGVYFVGLEAGDERTVKKIVCLK